MQKRDNVLRFLWAVILVGVICYSQLAKAGWGGLINGAGFGNSWVSVSHTGTTPKVAQTPGNVQSPSDTVPLNTAYTYKNTAPTGASAGTYSHSKGLPGGIWQNSLVFQPGDGNDNLELQARVNVVPVTCGALSMDSMIDINEFNANGHSGKISVIAHATGGTALWLRGFEYTGDPNLVPPDDPTTVQNESIEFLKTNGVWKFETLIVGPFDFGNGCPLIIPFSLDSGDLKNLYFASDGVGLSVPFTITCPPDVTQSCNQAVNYPPVHVSGGCGNSTLSFDPPNGTVFPVGTNVVTVTATDDQTNTVSCGFRVIVGDNKAPVPPVLPDLVSSGCTGSSVTPITPVATDNCAGSVLGTTTNVFPITALGTNLVWWKFDDGNGNVTIASQRVIITGLTFQGFYSPINGVGGSCTSPVVTVNQGSVVPIKFDLFCGSTLITGGTPPFVTIQKYVGCQPSGGIISGPAVYQNNWHFNWDTSVGIVDKGIYKIIVLMPNQSTQILFVKIK